MKEEIIDLARRKSFEALTTRERAMVLSEMPQEAYDNLHRVLAAAPALGASDTPPPGLRSKLLAEMTSMRTPRKRRNLAETPVPAWLAVAGMVLCFSMAMLWRKERVVLKTLTREQVRVDTVWMEKIKWVEKPADKAPRLKKTDATPTPMALAPVRSDNQYPTPDLNGPIPLDGRPGTSLADTPDLLDFFGQ